jgi:hypothetical protein
LLSSAVLFFLYEGAQRCGVQRVSLATVAQSGLSFRGRGLRTRCFACQTFGSQLGS